MKKHIKIFKRFALFFVGLGVGAVVVAASQNLEGSANQPGTTQDPLVSQSYVDRRINEVLQQIANIPQTQQAAQPQPQITQSELVEATVNEVLAAINEFYGYGFGMGAFVPVFVEGGQWVFGGEGTEIILRAGAAVAHVPGEDLVVNASSGSEIGHGGAIPLNHLLIIPREDGRGVFAVTDAWMLIRGGFIIQ